MKLAVGWRDTRRRSGGPGWRPRLATEQLGEHVECADVVLGGGGEVGADGGEREGSVYSPTGLTRRDALGEACRS